MSRGAALAALVLLAACGPGPQSTTSSGTVKGASFTEPYAIYNIRGVFILQDKLSVLISDDPSACDHLTYDSEQERPYLKLPDGSHAPSLWMKTNDHTDALTDMRAVGDDLQAIFDPGAPVGDECAQASCQGRWVNASKGTMEIEGTKDPNEADSFAAGSFYLTFSGEQLSGDFRAVPCKSLKVEGCSVAGGTAAPALGLLALALLGRRRRGA